MNCEGVPKGSIMTRSPNRHFIWLAVVEEVLEKAKQITAPHKLIPESSRFLRFQNMESGIWNLEFENGIIPEKIHIEIVTPEKLLVSGAVD